MVFIFRKITTEVDVCEWTVNFLECIAYSKYIPGDARKTSLVLVSTPVSFINNKNIKML
jgi:hypothetical protein